jgi:ribonuclease HI
MSEIYINTDGGSRGNPGPAGIGIVFFDNNEKIFHTHKECIGIATNNEAEYGAIKKALEIVSKSDWFNENNKEGVKITCRLDSQLVVEQINGNYKVKQPHLQEFISQIREILSNFRLSITFVHIPREENKLADKLVNEALDAHAEEGR